MMQFLLIGSLVGIVLALWLVKLRKASKRPKRWMPDIRRVA
jgi:hypothetical protein